MTKRLGREEDAALLISARTRGAGDRDGDTAYRLATYHAHAGDSAAVLEWLRRSIYLGNENYPWFGANPAWAGSRDDPDFAAILISLEGRYRRNLAFWSSLGSGTPRP